MGEVGRIILEESFDLIGEGVKCKLFIAEEWNLWNIQGNKIPLKAWIECDKEIDRHQRPNILHTVLHRFGYQSSFASQHDNPSWYVCKETPNE